MDFVITRFGEVILGAAEALGSCVFSLCEVLSSVSAAWFSRDTFLTFVLKRMMTMVQTMKARVALIAMGAGLILKGYEDGRRPSGGASQIVGSGMSVEDMAAPWGLGSLNLECAFKISS